MEGNRALGSRGAGEGGGRAREESSDGKLGHCFRSILLSINKLNQAAESRRERRERFDPRAGRATRSSAFAFVQPEKKMSK